PSATTASATSSSARRWSTRPPAAPSASAPRGGSDASRALPDRAPCGGKHAEAGHHRDRAGDGQRPFLRHLARAGAPLLRRVLVAVVHCPQLAGRESERAAQRAAESERSEDVPELQRPQDAGV